MHIGTILDSKGRDVLTINLDALGADLVRLLSEKKIGALAVVDGDGSLVGIVSERDVVRTLGKSGSSLLEMPVSVMMTASPVTCAEDESVDQVMEKMTAGRFRHMPVSQGGKLCGMISIGDVVKVKIEQAEAEKEALIGYMHS